MMHGPINIRLGGGLGSVGTKQARARGADGGEEKHKRPLDGET